MDELITDFVCESREMLQALEGELVAWEHDPANRERLDAIFRFVHTVKGNCGFLDLPVLQSLSHAVEDALNDVRAERREADRPLVDAVLAVLDRIAALIDAVEAGQPLDDTGHPALVAALAPGGTQPDARGATASPVAAEASAANVRAHSAQRTVRLPVALVDRVMSGVSDMVLARNELERLMSAARSDPAQVEVAFHRMSGILTELRGTIAEARMQPLDTLFASFQRKVRDLSAELGKKVFLQIESGQVDLDREIIELVREPLLHIVNNAVDHGIENPAERRRRGKPETGTIVLSARQTGNEVRIGIIDDGAGLDVERLRDKAVASGVVGRERASQLTREECHALVFAPGLSTSDSVTNVSGRGVGMDVVRASIERLGGAIAIRSEPGEGTRFILRLPLTLSIVPSLTVRAGGQLFAIPRSYVLEIIRSGQSQECGRVGGIRQVVVRGEQYPCIELGETLEVAREAAAPPATLLMIKLISGRIFGLAVDRIESHGELVVKPLALDLLGSGLFVGAAQLDDGQPALVVDIGALGDRCGLHELSHAAFAQRFELVGTNDDEDSVQLLAFDAADGRRLAVRLGAVERIVRVDANTVTAGNGGTHALVAGAVVALAGYAPALGEAGSFEALLLDDGTRKLAYAAAGPIDAIAVPGAAVHGSAMLNDEGRIVELLDCHAAFAALGPAPDARALLACRLPEDDPWCREFLRPLVESAGYRICTDATEPADLEIRVAGSPAPAASPTGARLLTLSERRDAADAALYRYDRAGIVAALAAGHDGVAA